MSNEDYRAAHDAMSHAQRELNTLASMARNLRIRIATIEPIDRERKILELFEEMCKIFGSD